MYTGIDSITTELGDIRNLATTLWFCGCKVRCGGCHNSPLIQFKSEGTLELKRVKQELIERRKLTEWLVFIGGNPLDSIDSVLEIARFAKELNYKQFMYTGYTLKEVENVLTHDQYLEVLNLFEYMKVGKYDSSLSKSCFKEAESYFFETINQSILKSNPDKQTWEIFYSFSPQNNENDNQWFFNI